jgi:hypothetical protein
MWMKTAVLPFGESLIGIHHISAVTRRAVEYGP